MLYNGEDIEQNKKEALHYFKISSDNGFQKGIYRYAKMIFKGEEIEADKKEALRLFMIAADKDEMIEVNRCFEVINLYGKLLFEGKEIEQNKEEAAYYFKRGADIGDVKSMIDYADMLRKGDGIKRTKKKQSNIINFLLIKEALKECINYD